MRFSVKLLQRNWQAPMISKPDRWTWQGTKAPFRRLLRLFHQILGWPIAIENWTRMLMFFSHWSLTKIQDLRMKCPKCQCENREGARFCNECGQNLASPCQATPKDLSFDEKIAKIQGYLPEGLTETVNVMIYLWWMNWLGFLKMLNLLYDTYIYFENFLKYINKDQILFSDHSCETSQIKWTLNLKV